MSSKIPKAVFASLAQKVRESPDRLRTLTFADATSAFTAVKTQDLRFDVHKNTQDPNMATGIIQANSEAQNKGVRDFIKGKTGGHRGTHQVIGDKIRFVLGSSLNVEAVARAIELGGVDNGEAAAGSSSGGASSQSSWTWSVDHQRYYRISTDGSYEWSPGPEATADGEWTWSHVRNNYFRRLADGSEEWAK